jgi:hypothetical protein
MNKWTVVLIGVGVVVITIIQILLGGTPKGGCTRLDAVNNGAHSHSHGDRNDS